MELIGHKSQKEFLKRLAENKRIPHAFLFVGENSLGKKKAAFEFIKFLGGDEDDIIMLQPQKKEIQINQVRDLQKSLRLRPRLSNLKSVIIDNAQSLNDGAQNCLLKTLEEPRGNVFFFLISSCPEMLLPTIRSRCAILKFYPLSFEQMKECFKESKNPNFEEILLLSDGRPGRVLEFLENPQSFSSFSGIFKEIEKLLQSNTGERFVFVKDFFEDKKNFRDSNLFLESLQRYLRFFLLKKMAVNIKFCPDFSFNQKQSLARIKQMIDSVERIRLLIAKTNINQKLALESLMLMI